MAIVLGNLLNMISYDSRIQITFARMVEGQDDTITVKAGDFPYRHRSLLNRPVSKMSAMNGYEFCSGGPIAVPMICIELVGGRYKDGSHDDRKGSGGLSAQERSDCAEADPGDESV